MCVCVGGLGEWGSGDKCDLVSVACAGKVCVGGGGGGGGVV